MEKAGHAIFLLLLMNVLMLPMDPPLIASSEPPATEWTRTYGGGGEDSAYSMVQTVDGGYILAGRTDSYGLGRFDIWLVKTDVAGSMVWSKTYGSLANDVAHSVIQTGDGGYVMAGYTESFGSGGADLWLIKTDSSGDVEWSQTYGEAGNDYASSIVETVDGGYAVAGYTDSIGAGGADLWLIKTDSLGNMEWNTTYGGTGNDNSQSIVQTADGGYAMAGYTGSYGPGWRNVWLVKMDSDGNYQWHQAYGGTSEDGGRAVVETSDGGFAIAGFTISYGAGNKDFWLIKTDALGNAEWDQTYGGTGEDQAFSLFKTDDGGYAVAGYTASKGAGGWDFWLVKINAGGNMEWDQAYGGASTDQGMSVVETADGGYAVAGYTISYGAGNKDFWLVKTHAPTPSFSITFFDVQNNVSRLYSVGETVVVYAQVKNDGAESIDPYRLEGVFTIVSPSSGQIDAGTDWNTFSIDPRGLGVLEGRWTIPPSAESGWYSIRVTITSKDTELTQSRQKDNASEILPSPPSGEIHLRSRAYDGSSNIGSIWVEGIGKKTLPINIPLEHGQYLVVGSGGLFNNKKYDFDRWEVSGNLQVLDPTREASTITVGGEGTLTLVLFRWNLTLDVSPTSQTVAQGNGAIYSVTVTATGSWTTNTDQSAMVEVETLNTPPRTTRSFAGSFMLSQSNPSDTHYCVIYTSATHTPTGTYHIKFGGIINSTTTKHSKTVDLIVEPKPEVLPDLVIEEFWWSPENPQVGDKVTFTYTEKNQGEGNASAHRNTLLIEGYPISNDLVALSSNTSRTRSFSDTWTATAGEREVTVKVDDLEVVIESDEENNLLSAQLATSAGLRSFWLQWWFWGICALFVTTALLLGKYSRQRKTIETYEPEKKTFPGINRLDRARMQFNADVERRRTKIEEFEEKHGVRIRRVEDTFEDVLERMGIKRKKE